MSDTVRLGIIGLGNMGTAHAKSIRKGAVDGLVLTAVCDDNPRRIESMTEPGDVHRFSDVETMLESGQIDAVLVATPHYSHTPIGIAALDAGLHVLMEKPISVHKADCEALIAAHRDPEQVFAAMFNQRTDPRFGLLRDLLTGDELGSVQRINWVITDWFRPEVYYRSGGWRATWAGEGGGVLLNQSPHQLDLWTWLFGMPSSVRAFCGFGRYHDIEVEDEATAYLRYANGASGVFIGSTGEAPGVNRLDIVGDAGALCFDGERLLLTRNTPATGEYSRTTNDMFGMPASTTSDVTPDRNVNQHAEVLANFAAAIVRDEPLIAPASEGLHSLALANAMLLSTWESREVSFPLDAAAYQLALDQRIAGSSLRQKSNLKANVDMSASYR